MHGNISKLEVVADALLNATKSATLPAALYGQMKLLLWSNVTPSIRTAACSVKSYNPSLEPSVDTF